MAILLRFDTANIDISVAISDNLSGYEGLGETINNNVEEMLRMQKNLPHFNDDTDNNIMND